MEISIFLSETIGKPNSSSRETRPINSLFPVATIGNPENIMYLSPSFEQAVVTPGALLGHGIPGF